MTTRFDIAKWRLVTLTMTAVALVGVVSSMLIPSPSLKLSDMCNVDASGNVVMDKIAVGRISHFIGSYFVEGPGGITTLSNCSKSGCRPFQQEMLDGHVGAPVRAEFCAGRAARLTISGDEVFHLTQQSLDRRTANNARNAIWLERFGIAWCCFWLLLQTIAEIHFNRIVDRAS